MSTIQQFVGDKLLLTIQGQLLFPLLTQACSRRVLIPTNTTNGVQTTVQPVNDIGLTSLTIGESLLSTSNVSSLSFDNLGFVANTVAIDGLPQLVSLNFPALDTAGGLTIASGNLPKLASLNLPVLAVLGSNGFGVSVAPLLTAISLPALTTCLGYISIYNGPTTSFSAPNLVSVQNNLQFGSNLTSLNLNSLSLVSGQIALSSGTLTSFSLPALTTAASLSISNGSSSLASISLPLLVNLPTASVISSAALTGFSAPLLATSGNINFTNCTVLPSVNLPALTTFTALLQLQYCPALTTLSLPTVTKLTGITATTGLGALANVTLNPGLTSASGSYNFAGQPLTVNSVNSILVALANATNYVSGTVTLNATGVPTPTGAGATAKTTLQGRGVTVLTN